LRSGKKRTLLGDVAAVTSEVVWAAGIFIFELTVKVSMPGPLFADNPTRNKLSAKSAAKLALLAFPLQGGVQQHHTFFLPCRYIIRTPFSSLFRRLCDDFQLIAVASMIESRTAGLGMLHAPPARGTSCQPGGFKLCRHHPPVRFNSDFLQNYSKMDVWILVEVKLVTPVQISKERRMMGDDMHDKRRIENPIVFVRTSCTRIGTETAL
jgi:hypothetical protein